MVKEALLLRPSDRRRFTLLILSAALLSLISFLVPILSTKNPWLLAPALLFPAAQTAIALLNFDAIRSSSLATDVRRPNNLIQSLSVLPTMAMFLLTFFAGVSPKTWLLVTSLYIAWGGLFELGLGLATPLRLSHCYALFALSVGVRKMVPPGSEAPVICWASTEMTEEEKPLFLAMYIVPLALATVFTTASLMVDPRFKKEASGGQVGGDVLQIQGV